MTTLVRPAASPQVEVSDKRWLLIAMAGYVALSVLFYPAMYTSIDEAATFAMAFVLKHGVLFPAQTSPFHAAEFYPELSPLGPHGRIYRFPIGFPALLAAVSWMGWRAFFAVNPLLHLLAAGCFARMLQASRVSPRYAVLYLLFPCYVLFNRTLFSDAFAASLTTIALYCLLCRRSAFPAGLLLGVAMLARSASLVVIGVVMAGLLAQDWACRKQTPLYRGRAAAFALGLLPMTAAALAYNCVVMGSPFHSAYTASALSVTGLQAGGPAYALSLLLIYPGMLLAPLFYRGPFWKEGLAATTLVVVLAASYNESTFGNSALQTLLSTPRQVLPVMPFYLLAYCGILAKRLPGARHLAPAWLTGVGIGLFAAGLAIASQHQKYLASLQTTHAEIKHTLPPGSTVYASKDAYKLYQPVWDSDKYRELPFVTNAECAADVRQAPVFAALYMRSRGFSGEDWSNSRLVYDLKKRFKLAGGPKSAGGQVQYYRVLGLKSGS